MWLLLAFCSAALLGFYDVFKKKSLANNAVLPVLGLNTLFSSLIFLPFILVSYFHPAALQDTLFYVPSAGWEVHKFIILKSFIVLSSWTFGYFGMKHLPLTIVGPINATRPVMTLVGALLIFGERLNVYQWIGVLMAIISFFMLSRSGKKEGIDFKHDKWIWFVVLAAVLGAVSGLYDKYLMGRFNNMVVQAWYNVYQLFLMGGVLMFLWCQYHRFNGRQNTRVFYAGGGSAAGTGTVQLPRGFRRRGRYRSHLRLRVSSCQRRDERGGKRLVRRVYGRAFRRGGGRFCGGDFFFFHGAYFPFEKQKELRTDLPGGRIAAEEFISQRNFQ